MKMAAVGIWWLLALVFPLAATWGVMGAVGWLGKPLIGVELVSDGQGRMVITKVHPSGLASASEARVGDVLLKIDGIEITEQAWAETGGRGIEVSILSSTDDRIKEFSAQGRAPRNAIVVAWWMNAAVFALTSYFIFWRSNRSGPILSAAILCLTAAISFAVAPAAVGRWLLWPLYVEKASIHAVAALFFVFFFMLTDVPRSRWPVLAASPWAVSISALILAALILLSFTAVPEIDMSVRRTGLVLIAASLLGGVGFLAVGYLGSQSLSEKARIRIVVIGTSAGILPFVLLSVVPILVGTTAIVDPGVTVLAVIFVPLSLGYAVMRHQLMAIRRFVHRGASYTLISLLVFLIYGTLIAILRFAAGGDVSDNAAIQVLLLVVLFAAIPFMSGTRRVAFSLVNHLLYHEYVDHPELSRRVSVAAAQSQNLDELGDVVLGTIARELSLSFAAFVELIDGEGVMRASVGVVPTGLQVNSLTGLSPAEGRRMPLSELGVPGNEAEAIVTKTESKSGQPWILCFGPKATEEPFEREDLELAQNVAGQVATIMENLELVSELTDKTAELRELNRRLVRTQETERAHIAFYLHDEPLQVITNLLWRHAEGDLPADVEYDLKRVSEDLRNFTARLHPAILEDLGLVRALEFTGSDAGAEAEFRFTLSYSGVGRDDRLDPDVELALYRMAQEALRNCQRHSKAGNVWASLVREDGHVTLAVEDDGVGLSSTRPDAGMHLGLVGMRERIEQLGGVLRISQRAPSGTRLVAHIPVDIGRGTPDRIQAEVRNR